ncbi:MAG TPA: cupin domain-containing protein [Stellaceae bacterium]|nr:cupin domain-containing protein [Stellaceae bacterium]
MPSTAFVTKRRGVAPDAVAPDGSQVHILAQGVRGGLALFTLPPGAVARAVAHRSVEEVWYFLTGRGRMWRKLGGEEEIVEVELGVSLTLPVGTHFQFRCDGSEPLVALGATMPPWPGEGEAYFVEGKWPATV